MSALPASPPLPGALMYVGPKPPQVFVAGSGSRLVDDTGRAYLDFVQGWAVNTLGHAAPEIQAALARQSATLINCSPTFYNAPQLALAEKLARASGLDRVYFSNSGAEANEGAIKLARKWGKLHRQGAYEIITFWNGFHGRTLATMSASGKAQWDGLFEPRVPGFPKALLNDIASVEQLITDKTVAIMLEPIQGEAGVVPATDDFLRDLRALTEKHGLLLILDEVQTGIGRTGTMFGFEHAGILPDIVTLAKGLGGGVPISALMAREAVCVFEPGDQGGTYGGNPLMTAVGEAIVDTVLTPGFLDHVKTAGAHLEQRLVEVAAQTIGGNGVRGRGLLLALDLGRDIGPAVVAAAMKRGLLINSPRAHLLRFMPALNVTLAEIDEMAELLTAALLDVMTAES